MLKKKEFEIIFYNDKNVCHGGLSHEISLVIKKIVVLRYMTSGPVTELRYRPVTIVTSLGHRVSC